MKTARVNLTWKKSVSADVEKVLIVITNDSIETTTELGPEVEEFQISVKASKAFSYKITSIDSEGLEATSVICSHTFGDLEAPQPATDLTFQVLEVVDEPDENAPVINPLGK